MWPRTYGRIILDEVDSTNAYALRHSGDLLRPTWIMARQQSKGHSRRGRAWIDMSGNFAATLLLYPAVIDPQVSFVMAIAVYDALQRFSAGQAKLAQKWPNDVLLNNGKVCGILLESRPLGAGRFALACGVGVNLAKAPSSHDLSPDALCPVSVYGETGIEIDQDSFLVALARSFDEVWQKMQRQGAQAIREIWLGQAAHLGKVITARQGERRITGEFVGLDDQGALILQTPQGKQYLMVAEVSLDTVE